MGVCNRVFQLGGLRRSKAFTSIPTATHFFLASTHIASDSLWDGGRWLLIVCAGLANIIINASLTAWDIPLSRKWTYYILGGLSKG